MVQNRMPNLEKVLQDFAKDIRQNYKEHLAYHDHFTTKGTDQRLIDSVQEIVEIGDRHFQVKLKLNQYWKYVEEGIYGAGNHDSPYKNPGMRAYPFILKWVEIKPVAPRPDKNGKLPSPKTLAFLITRSIAKNGTEGTHDLQVTKENVLAWYEDRIREALREDMKHYIKSLAAD